MARAKLTLSGDELLNAAATGAAENVDQVEQVKTDDQLQAESHLDALTADDEAAENAAKNPASPDGEVIEGQVITDPVQSLAGLLGMVGFGFTISGFKNLGGVWTNEGSNKAIAMAAIPVLRKYAWGARVIAFLSGETPIEEFALLMALAPAALATVAAYKDDVAERKAANDGEQPGQAAA